MSGFELIAGKALEIVIKREVQAFMRRRTDAATKIVIEELRTAQVDAEEIAQREDVAGMLVTFYMAMAQGAAFRNLRLIAKVLANEAAKGATGADDFIMWADAIKSLLPEEALLLATLHNITAEELAVARAGGDKDTAKLLIESMRRTREALVSQGTIKTSEDFNALCGALTRTGFIAVYSGFGTLVYYGSTRLDRLAEMAKLEDWANNVMGD